MNELSLFSGAGGGLLGTKLLGFRAVGYVEWEPYCQAVLAQRIEDGLLERAPIFGDIREFVKSGAAREYRGVADVVTAGFPCQPFSVAGKQAAADDPRNMWPATADVLREVRPRKALLENVPGLLATGYCERIFADLAALGFDARWGVFSAAEVGAPHIRERLFILADAESERCGEAGRLRERSKERAASGGEILAHAERDGLQGKRDGGGGVDGPPQSHTRSPAAGGSDAADAADTYRQQHESGPFEDWRASAAVVSADAWMPEAARLAEHGRQVHAGAGAARPDGGGRQGCWSVEPGLGRVADGVAHRLERLKALGNGQVPFTVAKAWRELIA